MINHSGARGIPRLDLGAAVEEYIQKESDFIGTKVLSIKGVPLQASNFKAKTRASVTLDADTKRAKSGHYNRISLEVKDLTYACEENGLEEILDDSDRNLYESDFDAEFDVSKNTADTLKRMQEKRIAAKIFNTSTFTGSDLYTNAAGTKAWSDITADILANVNAAKRKVKANCGLNPNSVIFNGNILEYIKKNTAVIDSIKYTARVTDAEIINGLADYLGVDYVLVGDSIRNSAKKGKVFASSPIWSDLYAMVAIVAPEGSSLRTPSLGRTMLWTSDSPDNCTVEEYRDNGARGDVYRVRQNTDEKVIDPYFAHLIKVT